MTWNWEQDGWPEFRFDKGVAALLEKQFLLNSGKWLGVCSHLGQDDKARLEIGLLSSEALESSSIEGEILNRESVQSSIQKQLGLQSDGRRVQPSEEGMAKLMVSMYQSHEEKLTHEMLYQWHEMVLRGRVDLEEIGSYRSHLEPMRVMSGSLDEPKIHFEAPPSSRVFAEMTGFLDWFSLSRDALPTTVRAALAHLYFESIHPFEDGNGRIGRAVAEFSVSQSLQMPVLIALSPAIARGKKRYYEELARASRTLEVTDWVKYFSETIVLAQEMSFLLLEFLLSKSRLMERLRDQLNPRQEKALLRMFAEGIEGFKGGLSSAKYQSITGASAASATRDLADLVSKEALVKTGKKKSTRYWLPPGGN